MQRKRIVVMGFMGGCPIAGVVWQHLHYIVGLQRLGHEVYYIEDSQRFPYNPVTWETLPDYRFAADTLDQLSPESLQKVGAVTLHFLKTALAK